MGRHSGRRTKMKNNPRETEATTYSNTIPIDLLFEILLRLPAKSVTRFVSVSKLFAKIIRSQDFIRSFSFRSSKQKQRVLLAFSGVDKEEGRENWFFLSSSLEESSSPVFLSSTACHAPELRYTRPICVHGLISFVYGQEQIISNPTTGKSITLPLVKSRRRVLKRFFGYDPVDDIYKVLCVTEPMFGTGRKLVAASQCQVLSLESSNHQNSWRNFECSIPHRPQSEGICTNGVLYYYAHMGTEIMEPSLVRFDLRSETFDFLTILPVEVQNFLISSNLINYKGNIASATRTSCHSFDLWVLEDFKKKQWLKVNLSIRSGLVDFRGIAHTGEIIYATYDLEDYHLILHDPKTNSRKFVEIDVNSYEFGRLSGVVSLVDYVESIMFS
ncbi:F-box associated domain type 3 [Arabidopsis thaliana x Arabidopsis arenosa]|uniref:F-box associated domain type 3 n=1 Tax=Arabidopsis thaliana x Arabidopsis arenosa TaxID=1240361 RepID=A0A8T1YX62_9BRAS|nr:F-box associated domain type 3 [Arabidopsis thaliana x Arabidopsis arenosa]